ncbi:hypothetical protein [Paraburkholderia lacunae]|uniref:Uncharacterized protein n=1 Tax=Paraburkholderia lacunae TaxID=2211104 RepID=A0A370N3S3_9BURK|nr:hypothetical protein [Paraburkholderia lacunae]RDK00269.1 hypothetical protein DLM46_23375 [Paraburkholderia lacunae]
MIELLSPAVLAAVLRVSSAPIFSAQLAMASLFTSRYAGRTASVAQSRTPARAASTQEGAWHV